MGTTLYISADKAIEGVELNNDRVFLAEVICDDTLMKTIVKNSALPPLSSFISDDPSELSQFIDDPNELAEAIAASAPVRWFNPADALPAIDALKVHYEQGKFIKARGRKRAGSKQWEPIDCTDNLLGEIADLRAILSTLIEKSAKFRLHVGF